MRITCFAILLTMLASSTAVAQLAPDTVFTHPEVMPVFGRCGTEQVGSPARKQCSDQALVQFLSHELVYPEEALANQVEGTVYVNFIIDQNGQVQAPNLLVDIGSGCGEAALEVIRAMPAWEPGLQGGHPVKVKLNLPVQFSLRNKELETLQKFTLTWGDIVGDTVTAAQLQRNLPYSVYVRGPEGDNRYVDELAFSFVRNKKENVATSRRGISEDLVAVVEKIKGSGLFTITASVQDEGQFIYVNRTFFVKD